MEASLSVAASKTMYGTLGMATKLATNIPKLVEKVRTFVISLQEFMWALVILVAIIAVCVLIFVVFRVIRIRGFWANHSENLTKFMDGFHTDIDRTRQLYMGLNSVKSVYQAGDTNLIDALGCSKTMHYLQNHDETIIAQNFDTYFKYYDIVNSSLDSWFHSRDFAQFSPSGDKDDGLEHLKRIISDINDIRGELASCVHNRLIHVQRALFLAPSNSKDYNDANIVQLADSQASARAKAYVQGAKSQHSLSYESFTQYNQQFIDLTIGMSVMHMYLSTFFDDLKQLHNSRRFSFFNYLIYLIKPYVTSLILNDIVNPWKDALQAKQLTSDWSDFQSAWDKIGDMIHDLPRTLAGVDNKRSEGEFKGGMDSTQTEYKPDFGSRENFIEGFGFLKGLLSIGDFFLAIFDVALKVAELVSKPMEIIPMLFKLVIGFVVGIFLSIMHLIGSLPPFNYVFFAVYFLVFIIIPLSVGSVFYALLFLTFAIVSIVLWVLDLMTLGLVSRLTRCENLPDIWYKRDNFVNDNLYMRALVCQGTCPSRFEPSGVFCKHVDKRQPNFCPQAQVYRIYKGLETGEPNLMDDFTPDAAFWAKTREGRTAEIQAYFTKRQEFLNKCSDKNGPYVDLVRTICSNANTVKLPKESDRPILEHVCKQAFCDGDPKEEFCYKYQHAEDGKAAPSKSSVNSDEIIKRIMKMIVMIIVAVVVILMFLFNTAN